MPLGQASYEKLQSRSVSLLPCSRPMRGSCELRDPAPCGRANRDRRYSRLSAHRHLSRSQNVAPVTQRSEVLAERISVCRDRGGSWLGCVLRRTAVGGECKKGLFSGFFPSGSWEMCWCAMREDGNYWGLTDEWPLPFDRARGKHRGSCFNPLAELDGGRISWLASPAPK